jgi:hypothetical protein
MTDTNNLKNDGKLTFSSADGIQVNYQLEQVEKNHEKTAKANFQHSLLE